MAPHGLSLMNTIKQYNGTKWVQAGPAQSTYCGNLFLLGATNTLGRTHDLQEPRMTTDVFLFLVCHATNTLGSTHKVQECQLMPLYFQACVSLPENECK